MNLRLTLIFVAIASIGVAQEIAKKNEAIYAEWRTLKLKNDSLENVLSKKVTKLSNEVSLAKSNIYGTLQVLNYSIEEENYYCNKLIDSLQNLSVSGLGTKPKGLTNYYGLCSDLKFKLQVPAKVVSTRQTDVDDALPKKANEQAEILAVRLADEKNVFEQISKEISRLELEAKNLNAFNNKEVSTYLTFYSDQLAELKLYNKSLQLKREEVKAKYAKEGPKGYALVYRTYFPDLFQDKDISAWSGGAKNPEKAPTEVKTAVQNTEQITQDELSSDYKAPVSEEKVDIFEIVEQEAEYPGGSKKMGEFLQSNLHYPDFALDMGLGGRCYVRFVISKTGEVSNVTVKRGVAFCEECDAEAIRVVKSMPNWIPGMNDGKPVNMWYNLPIKFTPN